MELTFTEELVKFLASFKKETEENVLHYRVGLLDGAFWLALEDECDITKADEIVHHHKDDNVDLYIYCDCEDLELLRGTTVDYENQGLTKMICFKDPRFGSDCFAGDIHPALRS